MGVGSSKHPRGRGSTRAAVRSWYGMVWYGMVWYAWLKHSAQIWYGMVWYGVDSNQVEKAIFSPRGILVPNFFKINQIKTKIIGYQKTSLKKYTTLA